jgi:tRNA pseudouridine55 synthase
VADAPDPDHVTLEIACGKGTYVRALARDLAAALEACGHVSALRRTRVGPFEETGTVTLADLERLVYEGRGSEALLPVETALDGIPALALTAEDAARLKQGRNLVLLPRQVETLRERLPGDQRTVSVMAGGRLVALCEMRAGRLDPVRVFNLDAGD